MGFFKGLANAVATMLILDEPFPEDYTPARVTGSHKDSNGYTVLEIEADNYRDAGKFQEGFTVEGDVSLSLVHTGYHKWESRVEPWNTKFDDESRADYHARMYREGKQK